MSYLLLFLLIIASFVKCFSADLNLDRPAEQSKQSTRPAGQSTTLPITSLLSCPHSLSICQNVTLPSNNFQQLFEHHHPNLSPYSSQNLKLLPDVNTSGTEYYTTTYHLTLPSSSPNSYTLLTFPNVYGNCTISYPNGTTLKKFSPFTPFLLPSPPTSLKITISPPLLSGLPSHLCPQNTDEPCGQGGDHVMAEQSYIQFTQGWDWIQASPDRGTTLSPGVFEVFEAKIEKEWSVRYLEDESVEVNVNCINCDNILIELKSPSGVTYSGSGYKTIKIPTPDAELWYPWTLGKPVLYTVTFTGLKNDKHVCSLTSKTGLRTSTLKNSTILMNNVPVFIQGGNWICLDQFFIKTSKREYYDAILSHKNMGINLLRVWGGGITENKGEVILVTQRQCSVAPASTRFECC